MDVLAAFLPPCAIIQLFFSQFPCFLFIFLGICRYISLYRSAPARFSSFSQFSQSSDSESSQFSAKIGPLPSYFIKRKLSYLQSGLFFLAALLGILAETRSFCTAAAPIAGLLYFFGAAAWILAGKLVELELDKEYSQEFYTHQLLCSSSLAVSLANLAFGDCFLWDFALHCAKIAINLLLSLYFLAKPADFEENPGFLVHLLNKFETFAIIQLVFGYSRRNFSSNRKKSEEFALPLLEISKNPRQFLQSIPKADSFKRNSLNFCENRESSQKSLIFANKSQFSSGNLSPHFRRNSETLHNPNKSSDFFLENRDFLDFSQSSLKNPQRLRPLKFEVKCLGWEKALSHEYYVFLFELFCENHVWVIKKSVSEVKSFNTNLEETLKRSIALYKNCVPQQTAAFKQMDAGFLELRKRGLESYLRGILQDAGFYAKILFDFIEFDYEKRVPVAETDEFLQFSEEKEDEINEFSAENPAICQRNVKESLSPSFKSKKKVVSDINFNNVRLVFMGIMRVAPQNSVHSGLGRRHLTVSVKTERVYVIKLEEIEGTSAVFPRNLARNLRTEIKMGRNYKELEEFHRIIKKNFENDCAFELPEENEEKIVMEVEEVRKWEEYFASLLNIPMIEENQTFKEFFYLDKARNKYLFNYNYDYERKETFKLDLTNF